MKRIIFTVTNDLTYDQRMQRICSSLAASNFNVLLAGRKLKSSLPFEGHPFQHKRIKCFFNKGFAFYAEYNFRLFFWLLTKEVDAVCAIDLDTILPCYFVSVIKRKQRIYDAHELFTEQKEILTRPAVHKFWLSIERFAVPKFKFGYTVNRFIADELKRRYNVDYSIVRNLPKFSASLPSPRGEESGVRPFIIYQGAVNEGRSFETLIPAMKQVDAKLIICGKGNFFEQAKQLIKENNVENKVELKGYVEPLKLKELTPQAHVAVMLFEQKGLNQYYSLSNRFFDYIMAGVPQVCVDYPEYKSLNDIYHIAYMVPDTKVSTLVDALNKLFNNEGLHKQLRSNCLEARTVLNWENEEQKLIEFYRQALNP
ncbi:MAG: glycosyltransferase [Ilyomonas sp.]